MAGYGRRTRRRYGRKRKRSMSTRALAVRSLRKVRRLAVRTRPEVKTHERIDSGSLIEDTGGVVHMISGSNYIPTGTEYFERVGKKVRILGIRIYYKLHWTQNPDVGNAVRVRLNLVQRFRPNGHTDPSYSAIFEDSSVISLQNQASLHEYKILRERYHTLKGTNHMVTGKMIVFPRSESHYNLGDGMEKNGYHFCTNYDPHINSGTVPKPTIDYRYIITFTDV